MHLGSRVGIINDDGTIPASHLSQSNQVPHYQPLPSIPLPNHPFPNHELPNQPLHNQQFPVWDHQFPSQENLYIKTDSIQVNTAKSKNIQSSHKSIPTQSPSTTKRNLYTYFNVKTGDSTKKSVKQRRSDESIHSTAVTFKDKRIAGVS